MALTITRPQASEYPAYYHVYIDQLPEQGEVLDILEEQAKDLRQLLHNLDDTRAEEAYAEGKWSIKELFQHMLDSERIFAYRALCIARGEQASLPGFDENGYAENSNADNRKLTDMLEEYELVRKSNLYLFRSFTNEMLDNVGIANSKEITLRGIIHVIAAHERHHMNILKSRYLNA
ncbi:DinB family protein [Pontibacter sp. KCTC 32443]|uniref:DinB family protein n=1 Tax=Pontibacter TaxID=323449 RepID=UPI00164D60EE|nr:MULTISPECIES: DinB family protein [Pontibacter]MBC5773541.1 DinB family protein [Pontibacter sp. KCTC 32443]